MASSLPLTGGGTRVRAFWVTTLSGTPSAGPFALSPVGGGQHLRLRALTALAFFDKPYHGAVKRFQWAPLAIIVQPAK